jgi:hypothetical protein
LSEAPPRTLVIACGALAREALAVIEANRWTHLEVECLPAGLHNRPELIPGEVRARIRDARARGVTAIYALYADCGTGGALDAVLDREGVARIHGPHCYAFYAGQDVFQALHEAEPGTFYLTDFLARQFDTLVWRGLMLDRHPELVPQIFGQYRRVVYLAQAADPARLAAAEEAAARLGLPLVIRPTGYGELGTFLAQAAAGESDGAAGRRPVAGHPDAGDHQEGPADGEARAAPALHRGGRPKRDAREAHRHRRLSRAVAARGAGRGG